MFTKTKKKRCDIVGNKTVTHQSQSGVDASNCMSPLCLQQ